MGGGDGQEAFVLSLMSVPHALLTLSLMILGFHVALTRGNELIRASLLAVALMGMPYAVCQTLVGSCRDPVIAEQLGRFWVGSVALVGPALMLSLLAITGRFERHRALLVVAALITVSSCLVTWTTDLVITGVWQTSWGLWYPRAGPLNDVHVGNVAVWAVVGMYLSRRGAQRATARQQFHTRRIAALLVLASLGCTDALLAHGIGAFPFGLLPAFFGVWVVIIAALRHDLLHSRGFDRAGAYELAIIALLAIALFVALWLLTAPVRIDEPLLLALLLAPLLAAAQAGAMAVRARIGGETGRVAREADLALEEYVDHASRVREEGAFAERLGVLLAQHAALGQARLYAVDQDGACRAVGASGAAEKWDLPAARSLEIDARVRPWLIANPTPIVAEDLPTVRLGGLREPVEDLMQMLDADVALPLVDRERLVGVIVTAAPTGGRALRDEERRILREAGRATAQAMTYVGLLQEAEARVGVAKEVEVAAAVQHARAAGEQRRHYQGCDLVSYYEPAAQFGGHWWSSYQLADGRVLVILADVCGQGVSAALVSFTAEGACETAQRMLGANVEVLSLMQILHASVKTVSKSVYAMSCFAALFDLESFKVTFANAGHPFPYVCRRPREGKRWDRAELRALVSRGTPLGSDEIILSAASMDLEPGDVVVFYSDSVVDTLSPEGVPYGDRRLQRTLRTRVRPAGDQACQVILDDVRVHCADRPANDDLNVIVLRLGAGQA